jgi:hypothetical protein
MFSFLRKEREDTEISRADMLYFLRSNFKFFGLLALVLSIIAVAVVLLMPKEYEKQVNLSVRQVPNLLLGQLPQQPGTVEVERLPTDALGNTAVRYAQQEDLGDVSISPRYDTVEQQVQLTLRSRDPESLDSISSEVVDQLKTQFGKYFEDPLSRAVESRMANLKLSNDLSRELLTQIEQPSSEALELQRAQVLTQIAAGELEIRDLEQAQSDLSQLAYDMVSVEIRNESGVHQASSRARQIALAILAALVGAAILTIVRGALWKKPRA